MKIEVRIKQSEVRVRSGVKLIVLILICLLGAYLASVSWLFNLLGILAFFFTLTTLLECWNVWRLRKRL